VVSSPLYCDACGAANQAQATSCAVCGQLLRSVSPSLQTPGEALASNVRSGLLVIDHVLKQRYRVVSLLGQGGMGAVYKAEDIQFGNRLMAVKEMSLSGMNAQEIAEVTDAFKREALMLAGLVHPNLPRVYDHFTEGGRWYVVMDFIEGETLEACLNKPQIEGLPVEEVLNIGIQLCTVLDYLHTRQPPIIFRDLKPANVLLTAEGHVYLIDFGIARHFKPGKNRDTTILGSPGYAAPEQYGKTQTTPSADIYSLGVTLHQLLSGNDPTFDPFQFAPLQLSGQAGFSRLETLIMQMLKMSKDERPASMAAIKQELFSVSMQRMSGQTGAEQPTKASAFTTMVKSSPGTSTSQKTIKQWLDEGNALYEAKHYKEALAAFEQAIQLDPRYASAYMGKGITLMKLTSYKEALAAFDRTIQLDPHSALAYRGKGAALYFMNSYEEALAVFELAIRIDPTFALAYGGKGAALNALERYEEALTAYDQAIHLDPKDAYTYNNRGNTLYNLQFYQEALVAHERAIQLDPELADAYNNKGNALYNLKHYQEALVAYDCAIQLDANDALAYYNKGITLERLGRKKEAKQAQERAWQLGYREW
jgi:serine/threonine protein kinase